MNPFSPFNRVLTTVVGVVVVVAVQVSIADAQTVKYTPPKGAPADGKQLTVAEALDGRVTIDFDEVRMDDAVAALKKATGIDIRVSQSSIDELGIAPDTPVTFHIVNITLRSALDIWLTRIDRDLTHMVKDKSLVIVSRDSANEQGMILRFYNIDDLLVRRKVPHGWIREYYGAGSGATWNFAVGVDELIDAITFINTSEWGTNGGYGTITEFERLLVVRHRLQIHEQLENLLRVLREIRDGKHAADEPGITIASETCQVAERAILKALDRRETFAFAGTALCDVAEEFQRRLKVPILVDRKALDEIGIEPGVPVTYRGGNVTAKAALEQILKDIDPTLTFAIHDEVLQITTREQAEEHLVYVAYPCGDLVLPESMHQGGCQVGPPSVQYADFDALIETISQICSPDSWPGGTGPILGIIEVEEPPVLIVEQTREVHEEIADLLALLRKARADRAPNGPPVEHLTGERAGDDEFQLVVYHLNTASRVAETDGQANPPGTNPRKEHEELIQLIKELIEPSSWSSKTVIRIVNDRLVVRHKHSVHRKIEELLGALGYLNFGYPSRGGGLGF